MFCLFGRQQKQLLRPPNDDLKSMNKPIQCNNGTSSNDHNGLLPDLQNSHLIRIPPCKKIYGWSLSKKFQVFKNLEFGNAGSKKFGV